MGDKDRLICAIDKESNSVRRGQTYLRDRQGEQQRATGTNIFARLTRRASACDKGRHICVIDKDGNSVRQRHISAVDKDSNRF